MEAFLGAEAIFETYASTLCPKCTNPYISILYLETTIESEQLGPKVVVLVDLDP